jgi:hypothetical protein
MGDIGKACSSASECATGMVCLLPSDKKVFGAGGPAGGYCTFACTMDNQTICDQNGSTCVDLAANAGDPPQSFCLQDCTWGTAGDNANKCHLRPDVACTQLSSNTDGGVGANVCVPTCSQDSQCPAGRKCDETFSVCVDVQATGTPLGSHCTYDTTNTMPDTCAGLCLPLGDGAGAIAASFCSRRCVVGVLEGCNWVPKSMSLATGGAHGVCVLSSTGAGIGDVGYCVQECATVADCSNKADPGGTCDTTMLDPMIMSHGFCSW